MGEMQWSKAVDIVADHVVRIATPRGSGTGFLISNGKNNAICGFATAAHVVADAHFWEEPIRIDHVKSGKSAVVRREERAVFLDLERDTATILCNRGELLLPADPLPITPKGKFLKVGCEIGWLGFPAIPTANLCFFAGIVSAWIRDPGFYLVDGVAINGVSGGPAFYATGKGDAPVATIGVVSAYVPNRVTGEVLPGLSVVSDVAQFHDLAPTFASLDQARSAEAPPQQPPSLPSEADRIGTPTRRTSVASNSAAMSQN